MGSLIHVTAWERVSTGRRVLCAFVRVAILFLLVFMLGYLAYAKRYQLAAKFWHWRHGNSMAMGNYEVPVPEHWFIYDQNYAAFTMMNTAPNLPRDHKFHTTAVITVAPFQLRAIGPDGLAFWLSVQRQWLARDEVESVEEKTLNFGDESVTMYDGKTQFLIQNPINRYLINSPMLPVLKKNSDGSLTIYIQKDAPAGDKKANWLPAPDGPIYLVMRLYWPKDTPPSILPPGSGTWQPPAIRVVQ